METGTRLRTARPKTASQLAEKFPISLVIPARNASRELGAALRSLSQNDLRNVEVLIIDDASTDETAAVAESACLDAPFTVIRNPRQQGPGAARNGGLKQARNAYVLFLDADVQLPAQSMEWVRESLDIYSHRPEVVGVLGVYSEKIPWPDFFTNYKNLYTCTLYRSTDTLSPFIHTPIFCIRKDILEEAGGFDTHLSTAEDFRLGIVLGNRGYRFIIDWRIAGTHLKRYGLKGILVEDLRRISDLQQIELTPEQRRFYYQAHRWNRLLALMLPGPVLILSALAVWKTWAAATALSLLVFFFLINRSFLRLCCRTQGWRFSARAAVFLFAEMLWAELALVWALIRRRRA